MNIVVVTTPNDDLKETGFGGLKVCQDFADSVQNIDCVVDVVSVITRNDLLDIVSTKPDLVVLAVKYISIWDGRDIWLSSFFEHHNINFTGSDMDALEFDSNKVFAKMRAVSCGLPTAKYFNASPGDYINEADLPLPFPLFLKPLSAANGNGVNEKSLVVNIGDYMLKVDSLYDSYKSPVLVEEYLDGREFTVAIIDTQSQDLCIAAIEIVPPLSSNGCRILGEETKSNDSEKLLKIEDDTLKSTLEKLACEVYIALGIKGFGRIDIKSNQDEECFFMEANLVPGMSAGTSYFPRAFEIELGINHNEVIALMLQSHIAKHVNLEDDLKKS